MDGVADPDAFEKQALAKIEAEIAFVIDGFTDGSIPDYQMSALLMALTQATITGLAGLHLWGDWPWWNNIAPQVLLGVLAYGADQEVPGPVLDALRDAGVQVGLAHRERLEDERQHEHAGSGGPEDLGKLISGSAGTARTLRGEGKGAPRCFDVCKRLGAQSEPGNRLQLFHASP